MPNTDSLALDVAGIETNAKLRTSRAGIYAAGDVTGRDQFVYMAAYEVKIAAGNAMNDAGLTHDNAVMPAVVFSDPQVASVGLIETAARAQGVDTVTSILPLEHVPRAISREWMYGIDGLRENLGRRRAIAFKPAPIPD